MVRRVGAGYSPSWDACLDVLNCCELACGRVEMMLRCAEEGRVVEVDKRPRLRTTTKLIEGRASKQLRQALEVGGRSILAFLCSRGRRFLGCLRTQYHSSSPPPRPHSCLCWLLLRALRTTSGPCDGLKVSAAGCWW